MEQIENIPGLYIQKNVLSDDQQDLIIKFLDNHCWSSDLSRRTVHFGYKYPYRGGKLAKIEPLTGLILDLAKILQSSNIFENNIIPDQCIVNEYKKSQGIGVHTDRKDLGSVIAAFSINDSANMIFKNKSTNESFNIYLPKGSLIIMKDDARWNYTHQIPSTGSFINDEKIRIKKNDDYRRISITYRYVNL